MSPRKPKVVMGSADEKFNVVIEVDCVISVREGHNWMLRGLHSSTVAQLMFVTACVAS